MRVLQRLNGLTELRDLILDNTPVTDAGLEHLTKLSKLDTLFLRNTKVTAEGVKRLGRAMPRCKVTIHEPWYDQM